MRNRRGVRYHHLVVSQRNDFVYQFLEIVMVGTLASTWCTFWVQSLVVVPFPCVGHEDNDTTS